MIEWVAPVAAGVAIVAAIVSGWAAWDTRRIERRMDERRRRP